MTTPRRSFWLQEAADPSPDEPHLEGGIRADVCIVGGGYVGLWTAYWLKRWDPGCRVVVLEQDVCGGGASGRNGGFVLSWFAKLPSLLKMMGPEEAVSVCRQSQRAIGELGEFCQAQGIDAGFTQRGWLWTARADAHMGSWNAAVRAAERYCPDAFVRLDPSDVARRTGSARHLGGVFDPFAATVQPGRLVRGLRRVVLRSGVRIHEHSRVRRFSRSSPHRVFTSRGSVTADTVVIATNAWAANIRELQRHLVVVSSDVVVTAPIPDRLTQIGWTGGEAITDSQLMVNYYRTTSDGRIAFGKGGWGVAFAGFVTRGFDRDIGRARVVARDFRQAYPALADVPIEHDWSGPIDRSADGLPLLGQLGGRSRLLYGVGWSGNGVGPSLIGGKTLASKALGLDNEYSRSPLWNRAGGHLPPEPIRYIGAHVVREAVRRKEQAEMRDQRPNRVVTLLAGLVPAGLEDH